MLRRVLIAVALLFLAAGLQATWPGALSPLGVRPDLLLLFSLAAGLQLGTWPGMFVGFAAGVILGALGAHNLTTHVVTCTTAGFVGGLMSERLHVDRFVVPAIAAGAFSLAAWPAQALLTGQSLPAAAVLTSQAAYNSLLSPLFFQIARVARPDRSR